MAADLVGRRADLLGALTHGRKNLQAPVVHDGLEALAVDRFSASRGLGLLDTEYREHEGWRP